MVKVARMRTDKWIALGLALATIACSTADQSARPVAKPAQEQAAAVEGGGLLTEVRAETRPAPRVVLGTSGNPAYTSYSPQPDVYVVDLPRMARANGLEIPTDLPEWVASVSVDEAIELGRPLTRVTMRFREPLSPSASTEGNAVVVSIPAPEAGAVHAAGTAEPEAPELDVLAPVREEPIEVAEIVAETAPEPAAERVVPQPEVIAEKVGRPAKNLRNVRTTGSGVDTRIVLEADGDIQWKSFELKNPHRVVYDLLGVTNRVKQSKFEVGGGAVRSVRVAQFASKPEPVTRVVIDMGEAVRHGAQAMGADLAIGFGEQSRMPVPTAAPPRSAPAEKPARVASVAPENVFEATPERERQWTQTEQVFNAQDVVPPQRRGGSEDLTQTDASVTSSVRATVPQTTAVSPEPENVFLDARPRTGTVLVDQRGTDVGVGSTLSGAGRVYTGDPIRLNLKDADIRDVLRTFAQLTGLNIAIDPQVTGTVTVEFEDVPWDQALELILRQNGLDYTLEGNVMRVGTVERLAAEEAQRLRLEEDRQLNVALQTVVKDLSYSRAGELVPLLQRMASRRGTIQFDARTNQLIISEIPGYLTTMLNLIDTLDIPTPQVVIEARVVETTKTFARSLGIEWGFGGVLDPALGTGTGLVFPSRVGIGAGPFNLGAGSPVLGISLSNVLGTFDLDLTLTAAESEGLARIISAPKILAQDNEAAEIQSGIQIPIQTRVNQTTTVTYIDATLRLSVTPQITAEDTVIMEVTVQKSEPLAGINVAGGQNAPLSTRRATTKLMVRDGGTAVIGGIYQATDNDQENRIPFLADLPVVGNLFRNKEITQRHDELLIFITPRIVRAR